MDGEKDCHVISGIQLYRFQTVEGEEKCRGMGMWLSVSKVEHVISLFSTFSDGLILLMLSHSKMMIFTVV